MKRELSRLFRFMRRQSVAGVNEAAHSISVGVVVRFAFLCGCLMLSLSHTSVSAQYRFDSWTTDNGLPQNSVFSIQQTSDGYLWLTTFDGLVRFDGVRFAVFNKGNSKGIASNRLLALLPDGDTLWLGTEDSGLTRYSNGQGQTFTVADGLPSNQVNSLQKDLDGSLLILTTRGLARWRDGRITVERQDEDFRNYKIYVSPANSRWEMDARGLRRFQNAHSYNYGLPFDPLRISRDRTFNYLIYVQMLEDRDGSLWLSASGNVYRLKDGAVTTYTAKDGVPASLVRDILQDRHGQIWIATQEDGICRLNVGRFGCYNKANGLSSNYVRDIFEDREGTLWVGTNERGINRLTRQVVTPLSSADGLADKNVYPLLEARDGSFWIGSFSALSHYKDGKIENFIRREGLLYEIVQGLHEDRDGRLWVGSIGGVEYYEGGKFIDFTERLGLTIGDVDFRSIQQDSYGALWFCTNKGLTQYQSGAVTRYTTENGLPSNDVKAIYEARDGSLWIATYGGVAVFTRDPSASHGPTFRTSAFREADGLTSNRVRTIFEDTQGTFWIGTYDGGLSRFRDGKFINYTSRNGLYSDGVFQILEDAHGWFWMSSNQGIYRVSRQLLEDFAAGRTSIITSTAFGKSDGMLNTECNGGIQPAGIKARDGKLWFPTQDGVAIIDPDAVPFNPQPPPVVIESASLQGATVPLGNGLKLTPRQDNLEIRYTGLSFIKPEQIRFRYRLEGLDESWTQAGTRRVAYYPYLPPGRYTFRVIAANSDNVWNEQGAAIEIVVLPPFYRTSWFTVLAICALAVIAFVFYQRRETRFKREQIAQQQFSRQLIVSQEAERRRIAAELHDSLGQHLLIIKNRAALGEQFAPAQSQTKEQFDEINASAVKAIGEVRAIAYNLRPLNMERLGLTTVLEEMIENVSRAAGIQFSNDIEPLDNLFSPENEISFYRIIQESVSNIVKHSGATKANIEIWRQDGELHTIVRDNGRGFNPETTTNGGAARGLGLTSISERVRMLGGTYTINSNAQQGTTLNIKVPISDQQRTGKNES